MGMGVLQSSPDSLLTTNTHALRMLKTSADLGHLEMDPQHRLAMDVWQAS